MFNNIFPSTPFSTGGTR